MCNALQCQGSCRLPCAIVCRAPWSGPTCCVACCARCGTVRSSATAARCPGRAVNAAQVRRMPHGCSCVPAANSRLQRTSRNKLKGTTRHLWVRRGTKDASVQWPMAGCKKRPGKGGRTSRHIFAAPDLRTRHIEQRCAERWPERQFRAPPSRNRRPSARRAGSSLHPRGCLSHSPQHSINMHGTCC